MISMPPTSHGAREVSIRNPRRPCSAVTCARPCRVFARPGHGRRAARMSTPASACAPLLDDARAEAREAEMPL